jgi:hypothetical protein
MQMRAVNECGNVEMSGLCRDSRYAVYLGTCFCWVGSKEGDVGLGRAPMHVWKYQTGLFSGIHISKEQLITVKNK